MRRNAATGLLSPQLINMKSGSMARVLCLIVLTVSFLFNARDDFIVIYGTTVID